MVLEIEIFPSAFHLSMNFAQSVLCGPEILHLKVIVVGRHLKMSPRQFMSDAGSSMLGAGAWG